MNSRTSHLPSWRTELLITLLGVLGLVLFLAFYDRAFPSAALDLALSREELAERAREALEEQGHEAPDYEFVLTFRRSFWSSIYLQRQLGVPETIALLEEGRVPVWYWHARWFRPLQKEEFSLDLLPDGRVVGWRHVVLEDEAGAALSEEEARALAHAYLQEARGWDLEAWEEISASSEERPGGRIDHAFEWKRPEWDVGESQLRLSVTVQGGEVGGYDYWLKVPEAFTREFAEQQNVAGFINNLSFIGGLFLFVAIGAVAVMKSRMNFTISWSSLFLPLLLVMGVTLAAGLNELPLAKSGYSTTQDYLIFWLQQGMVTLLLVFVNAFLVAFLWIGGQWLSQRVWPRQDRVLSRRGDRWYTLARSAWRGLMLGFMMGGYLVLFYLIATELFGGWTPLSPDYTYAYATPLPFLSALESGIVPAMTEELLFRLVGISAFLWLTHKLLRLPKGLSVALALLIPGALWGFAHLSYVRDPFYLRGLELTLVAVLLEGLFFLKFDLTTAIMAHFVYNAGLGALPLLRSDDPYFVVSGLVVLAAMVAPVVPGAVAALRRKLRGRPVAGAVPFIREARSADREALAALPCEGVDWDALLEGGTLLCLEVEGRVVGVAAARHLEDAAEVVVLYVAKRWRRRYWGSELLVELLERLQDAGLRAAATVVPTAQESLVGFWSSRGWGALLKVYAHPLGAGAAPDWDRVWQQLRGGASRLGTPPARVTRSKEEAREAYDRLSRWYDLLAEGSEKEFREQGLALLEVQVGERALEVGSGTGHALAALARDVGEAGRVYGLDISPGMHARARERLREAGVRERVTLLLGDGARLPFEDESLDALFMSFTLELFDTPQIPNVLAECRRVLRPSGRLCVVSLARREGGLVVELYEWVHRTLPKYVDCRPIHPVRALEDAGFEVGEVERGSTWGLPVDVVLARPAVEVGS